MTTEIAAAPRLMTTEELLALPEDGVERDLIRGELRERPMTRRNRRHSRVLITLGQMLKNWLDVQPEPRGEIVGGEAGVRLRRNPDTTVGVDLAYFSAETAARTAENAFLIEGAPILAVEILSPNDQQDDILEKVRSYLEAGTRLVWVVEPVFRTVTAYRADAEPELFNASQDLTGEPHLPGFRVPVAAIFAR